MQQILAYETDLLEYEDLFDGNPAIDRKVQALKDGARAELAQIDAMGGAVAAHRLHERPPGRGECRTHRPHRIRRNHRRRREPLHHHRTLAAHTPAKAASWPADPDAEADQIARLHAWKGARSSAAIEAALGALRSAAQSGANIMRGLHPPRQGGRHHRRMGRRHPRGLRRIPRAHRRLAAPRTGPRG